MPARSVPPLHLRPLETYPPDIRQWLELFESRQYRAALDPIEAAWFANRNEFLRGLIKLTVGMNQAENTALTSGPRTLLTGARDLLKPYAPEYEGIDVAAARHIATNALRRVSKGGR